MSSAKNLTFLSGANSEYIAHLFNEYLNNRNAVDASWQAFFGGLDDNEAALLKELHGASWTPIENRKDNKGFGAVVSGAGAGVEATVPAKAGGIIVNDNETQALMQHQTVRQSTLDSVRALMLIRAYRARGHLIATLDPLGLKEIEEHPELDPAHHGFSADDYDRPIFLNGVLGLEFATLREILATVKKTYCDKIGVEYLHMSDPDEKAWIQQRIEGPRNQTDFTQEGKKAILERLTAAEGFESFLHTKYPGTKRFGLDGGEALIPALEQIIKRGGQLGVKEIVLGMAHRGRLNVLSNVMGKSFTAIFSEFQGNSSHPEDVQGSGDVKYHLGTSSDREFDGNSVHLSLTANPSHLEAVNPVVIGKVRAKQKQRGDADKSQVLPLLLHGDAAFAGQGLVAETLMISELPGYSVGGTIHVVINNQIGFTTTPAHGRSGPYSTDVAKMLSAPIFHVNGDDPEAVVHVARIATEFRQEFKKDVVIDLYCYRRYGHNEGDEPSFTQPIMYDKIKTQKTVRTQYAAQLVSEGILAADDPEAIEAAFKTELEESFKAADSYKPNKADYLEGAWSGLKVAHGDTRRGKTALNKDVFETVGKILTTVPDDFNIHRKITRQLDKKKDMFAGKDGFDWATAEGLAFGSLLEDGYSVRLSGQDVGRGTFSHRHAILYDQKDGSKFIPLMNAGKDDAQFSVYDSPLSEAAVLGFEYGHSLADPKTLAIWEAQFGDFANGAQVLIDQFISSGESKWLRMSGLTMLLPHGYEGQGPEHSSARLERFLQMCAEDNMQVCNITTPANYFHALRRQMTRDFRKPLVVMAPKSLLRHKLAVSPKEMFMGDNTFHRILWDDDKDKLVADKKVKRVVLCSGKVYYDLYERRAEKKIKDVVILRIEQLYPFPLNALAEELKPYSNADIVWCQEEPKNMGSWYYISEPLEETLQKAKHKARRASYVGRVATASTATGFASVHKREQTRLVDEALGIK